MGLCRSLFFLAVVCSGCRATHSELSLDHPAERYAFESGTLTADIPRMAVATEVDSVQAAGRSQPRLSGFVLDLGSGVAPYDDAPPSNALLPVSAPGFSDTVIRLRYEEPLGGGLSFTGDVAASRYQDEPIWSGLSEAEFAWLSFGIQFRF